MRNSSSLGNQQGSLPSGLEPAQALAPSQAEGGAEMSSTNERGAECADFSFLCPVHSHDSTPDKSVSLTVTKKRTQLRKLTQLTDFGRQQSRAKLIHSLCTLSTYSLVHRPGNPPPSL